MDSTGLADYQLHGDNDRGGVLSLSSFGIEQPGDDRTTFDMMDSFGAPSQGLFDTDTSYFDRATMAMDLGGDSDVASMMSMTSFKATSPIPNKTRRAPAPTAAPLQGGAAKTLNKPRDTPAAQWVDPETVMCEECGSGESAPDLLICDGCNKGRHTYCLPLALAIDQIAEQAKWYCPLCVLSRAKLKQRSNVYLKRHFVSAAAKVKRDKSLPSLEQATAQGMLYAGEDEDDEDKRKLTASSETKKRVPKKSDESAKRKKTRARGSESEEDEDEEERPARKRRALTTSNNGAKKQPSRPVTGVTSSPASTTNTAQNIDAVFLSLVPLPNRMPLPQLHFRDKTLSELYDRVPSQTYECLDWHDFRIEFAVPAQSAQTSLGLTHVTPPGFSYPDWPAKVQPGPPRDLEMKPKKEMGPGPMSHPGPYTSPPVKQPGMTSHPINFPAAGPPTSPFAPPSPYGTAPPYPFEAKPAPTAPYPTAYPGPGYHKGPPPPMHTAPGPNYFASPNSGMGPGPTNAPGPNAPMPMMSGYPTHNPNPEPMSYSSPNSAMNYPSPPKNGPAPSQTPPRGPPSTAGPVPNTAAYPNGAAPLPSRASNMKWHNNVAPSPNPPPVPAPAKNPAKLIWNQAVANPYRPGPVTVPPTATAPNRAMPSQTYLTAPAQNVPKQIPMNPDQRAM